jgi:hypothetical protein
MIPPDGNDIHPGPLAAQSLEMPKGRVRGNSPPTRRQLQKSDMLRLKPLRQSALRARLEFQLKRQP